MSRHYTHPVGNDAMMTPPEDAAPLPEWMPSVAVTDLARILAQARHAHTEYLEALPRMIGGRQVQDLGLAGEALERATAARETADALDPDHSDPAWADDIRAGYDHWALLTFYRAERSRQGR